MSPTALRLALATAAFAALAGAATAQTGTIGYSWQGATLANEGSGWPPDTHGSVGVNHFVQAVNGGFQIYNKDGTGYTFGSNYISNHNFWTNRVGLATGVPSNGYTDPRIYYDSLSQRWFAVEITDPPAGANRILIGRSDTSDPTGSWAGLMVTGPAANQFMDYPTLAVDANGVYVATNNFGGTGTRSIVSVPLASFLDNPATTTPAVFHNPTNGGNPMGFTLHGVTDTTGATVGATSALMFGTGVTIGSDDVLARTIINNPGGTATLTGPSQANGGYTAVLPSDVSGAFAPQLNGPTLDNGDNRNSSAIYRVGNLVYMVRAVDGGPGAGGRSVARWTVLGVDNATNAVTVVREGTIDLGGSIHASYPSIAANERGDFVLSFSRAGPSEFPSIWAVVGTTSDHSNWSVGTPIQLQQGFTFQNIGSGGSNRWGDYSATTRDPADPGSFWVTNEYMHNVAAGGLTANQNWATQVIEVIPTISGEARWKNPVAGSFGSAANWQTGSVPGSADHVIFSRWSASSYQVDLPAATTTTSDRLSVRQTGPGVATFNIPAGATWSLTNSATGTPSLAIAEFLGQSNVAVSGGGTLQTNHAIIAGQAGGTGALAISGAGTTWNNAGDLFVGGSSTAAGGTGTLSLSASAAVNVGGTLKIWNTESGVAMTDAGTALAVAGLTNHTGTNPTLSLGTGTTLTVTDGLGSTFSGTIGGDGSVVKSGPGSFSLAGSNTYAGSTTVTGGVLLVNGQASPSSGTGSGPVTVNGGTLGGTGRIGGTVTVASAATLAPGAGVGTLSVAGNTLLNAGSKLAVEVDAPGTADLLAVEGSGTTLAFTGGSILELSLLGGFTRTGPAAYTLATLVNGDNLFLDGSPTTDGAVLGTFIQGGGTSGAVIIQPSGATLFDGDQFVLSRVGNTVKLQFSPVPEPGTVLAMSFGSLAAGAAFRRRWRQDVSAEHPTAA
jgi:autotransporter-associated beta strand protein/T5SS/PEP-CTERM-associated repeat protein